MKYYPILFLLFVVYSSCTLSNKTDVTKSVADSTIVVLDSDVIAQIEEDKRLEKYFNQVTDPICDITYKHNSFDYVPINNKTIAWFKKCKQDLIFFYDSNHPASQLSDNAKVDSLFMELEFHFDLNNEEIIDKHLGIFNQSLRKAMIIYRITDKTIEMLQRHKNFENEQMAWERMQMALEEFYLTAEELSYTGGTGSDVLCLMSMNAIYKNREDDLKRMLSGKCPDELQRGEKYHRAFGKGCRRIRLLADGQRGLQPRRLPRHDSQDARQPRRIHHQSRRPSGNLQPSEARPAMDERV